MLNSFLASILFCFFSLNSFSQVPSIVIKEAIKQTSPERSGEASSAVSQLDYDQLDKLRSPRQTMKTFIEAMDEVKKGNSSVRMYLDQASKTLDLSTIEEPLRERTGRLVAERLINTIDRVAKVNYDYIPNHTDGQKWYFRKQILNTDEKIKEAEIAIVKNTDGAWRFSSETVNSIDALYSSISHLKVVNGVKEYSNWKTKLREKLPDWTREDLFIFTKGQWMGFLLIFVVAMLALSLMRFLTTQYIHSFVKKESLNFKEKDHYKSTLSFGLLAFSLVCMGGIQILEVDIHVYNFLVRTFYILIAITSVWSLLRIVDLISLHFDKIAKDTSNKFDDVLVPMLSKTAKVLVVSFGAILVAHSLTFDIGSILAGLGIGGVAVALAAKDTISNLFGSVTVIMDRPFVIGDYVSLDKGLEGTVEEVGFRSTRIRTPYQSLVSLPNNVLANMAIDNYGMRDSRRFRTFLQVDYKNSVQILEEFCERVRYLCKIHPLIESESIQVYLHEMTDKSINILLNVFFKTKDGRIELEERHKLIVEVLKLADEMKISFVNPASFGSNFEKK